MSIIGKEYESPPEVADGDTFDLEIILEKKLIIPVFHPIVSLSEQTIIGVEALARGIHPVTGGIISPVRLFEEAKRRKLTLPLDNICRRQALVGFSELCPDNSRLLLWLNFEPSVLDQIEGQRKSLKEQATDFGLDPRRVVIEIVESKSRNVEGLRRFVNGCKREGFLIAIDDWGADYSNMERLDLLEPDVIKIHRSLVCELETTFQRQEMVRSMLGLAHRIGALVVIEGVETEETALAAMDLGACIMQGFFFSLPDRSWVDINERCSTKIKELVCRRKSRKKGAFNARRSFFGKMEAIVGEIREYLRDGDLDDYEPILRGMVHKHPELECLYLLDEQGVQITSSIISSRTAERNPYLFNLPSLGADRSFYDFFILIQAGLSKYSSEPYISRTTGALCVTVSQSAVDHMGRRLVICADCRWPREPSPVALHHELAFVHK